MTRSANASEIPTTNPTRAATAIDSTTFGETGESGSVAGDSSDIVGSGLAARVSS